MRDLLDILAAYERIGPDETGVLASIVHARGSTYRRIGGRMLVAPDDRTIGLISGGCLEADLVSRAQEVRRSRRPAIAHYDATASEDIVWGLGLGCAGVVDVLLEPVTRARPGPLALLAEWRAARATGVLATSLAPDTLGARFALHPDGRIESIGDMGEGMPAGPSEGVRAAMLGAAASGASRCIAIAAGEWSLEVVRPPCRLVVFGAGPDASPVVRLALEQGWDVEVVDHRRELARPERFPGARVHAARPEEVGACVTLDAQTHAIVMTHHYLVDRDLLAGLLASPAPYIGVLGPRQRTDDLLAELEGRGVAVTSDDRERVHGPAGLDVGGEGPEAIALSLVAEVLAFTEARPGGALRDRKGPIHEPPQT